LTQNNIFLFQIKDLDIVLAKSVAHNKKKISAFLKKSGANPHEYRLFRGGIALRKISALFPACNVEKIEGERRYED